MQLVEENSKLKRLVADLSLDKAMLQNILSKKDFKAFPQTRDTSALVMRIKEICATRVLYGYGGKAGKIITNASIGRIELRTIRCGTSGPSRQDCASRSIW